jgi:putative transposase
MKEIVREFIRQRSIQLYDQGERVEDISRFFSVSPQSIYKWINLSRSGRPLRQKPTGGRPRRIQDKQLGKLEKLLEQGAKAHGWNNDLWTTNRVKKLIRRELGIDYSYKHTWYLIRHYLGWTSQKPITRYGERDEEEIQKWPISTFKEIVSEADSRRAYIAFADEAGFMLMPTLRKTYAPCGKPPIVRTADPHGRISTLCALTLSPVNRRANIFFEMLQDNMNYTGKRVANFLEKLRKRLASPCILIWDCIPIHTGKPINAFAEQNDEITFRAFPKYAPELNPVDKVWAHLKYGKLANYAPENLEDLRMTLTKELMGLKKNTRLLRSFVAATGLSL